MCVVHERRLELDRWLQVILLKPQTRQHLLLLQFIGLVAGWDGADLGNFMQGSESEMKSWPI
jgi:hypothetical protein